MTPTDSAGRRLNLSLGTRIFLVTSLLIALSVGASVAVIHRELMLHHPLVDELVVIDDGSTDDTAAVAAEAGATVVAAAEVLPEYGTEHGKGQAMWRAVHVTSGDLLVFCDADIRPFDPGFVLGDHFVYQGTVDPLGGVNTIWPLFGISNQMLAGIALLLATTVLIKLKRERYAWVTLAPTAWLLVCTLTAGWMKAFSSDPRVGFYALANKYSEAASAGTVLAPAKSIAEMERVAFNNYICGTLTVLFVALVLVMAYFTLRMSLKAFRNAMPSAAETPPAIREGGLSGAPA